MKYYFNFTNEKTRGPGTYKTNEWVLESKFESVLDYKVHACSPRPQPLLQCSLITHRFSTKSYQK